MSRMTAPGRRLRKAVYAWDPDEAEREGRPLPVRPVESWLPLLQLDAQDPGGAIQSSTVVPKFPWGLDLSGQSGYVAEAAQPRAAPLAAFLTNLLKQSLRRWARRGAISDRAGE